MLEHIENRIFLYGGKYRGKRQAYYVTKAKHSCGGGRAVKNRYFITRVTYSDYMTVKIRIGATVMASLACLDNAARIALSEKLITEQLCQGCQKQKSREPPVTVTQQTGNNESKPL